MNDADQDLVQLFEELTRSVEQLQSELATSRGSPRPPTPRQLARFTSEVTIPAVILVLETNVRALRLVQRALRLADGSAPTESGDTTTRERATTLGRETLSHLDDAMADLQSAVDGRAPDDDVRELVERIRDLQSEIDAQLAVEESQSPPTNQSDSVNIDVDAELESLKDDIDTDEGN